MDIRGVVVRQRGGKPQVEDLRLADPGPGEVLVRVLASGVCHSDMHYQRGELGDEFPYLLGHEGAGVVEACGDGVSSVEVGDYVALTYRAPCLSCRFCASGRLDRCVQPVTSATAPTSSEGDPTRALGLGTLATHVMATPGQTVPIPAACPPEVACLLGCGASTGVGAVLNTAQVPAGASVAVVGCGGVGVNVLQGARLARASVIVAVDLSDAKLEQAARFGATHTVKGGRAETVDEVRAITGGQGVDFAFDVVASPASLDQCLRMLDYRGTAVLVGFPGTSAELALPMQPFFYGGTTLKVSLNGDLLPSRDLPVLVDAYLAGQLDLDSQVTRRIDLSEVQAAFDAMAAGEVVRSVVTFAPAPASTPAPTSTPASA